VISVDEALAMIRAARRTPTAERVPISLARDRRLAEDVISPRPVPFFDNSAMDGYAVGGPVGPWEVVREVPAGASEPFALGPCEAARIFTGSPVPERTFAVIPQEEAHVLGAVVDGEATKAAHIRFQGEELASGALVLKSGILLTPPCVAAVASMGKADVMVECLPRITVLTTGNEVQPPGEPLEFGQIFNSNQYAIKSLLDHWGLEAECRHVEDRPGDLNRELALLADSSDLVITTGGVSVGCYDYVLAAAKECGFKVQFHGVAVKPGKPIAFGTRNDGMAWFGLPGNPLSAWVGMLVFVAALLGRELPRQNVRLSEAHARKGDREEFVPAVVSPDGQVELVPTVGSHANTVLVEANALARLPKELREFKAGDRVEVLRLPWEAA